mmetsp:Transcript_17744/g.25047  ORF Transcript_17744/g.25047 Transcript_17744/m.25047 type:complete len:283 (+) Transcript_17744:110-958(+)
MKFLSATAAILFTAQCTSAFTSPAGKATFGLVTPRGNVHVNMAGPENPLPFFANAEKKEEQAVAPVETEKSVDEEVEELVQAEIKKNKRVSNLRNANGVDYAPWMGISAEDEEQIRQLMLEKTKARRARKEQEKSVTGNLYLDSQAQELSGTGLNSKIIDGEVELEWATKTEKNTAGFKIKRRPAKTEDFIEIASYESFSPLVSKGEDGGVYRYLDTTSTPGGWVYRISECDKNGSENDLCQCLVEVQTAEEQKTALIAGVGIGVLLAGAVVAGLVLDPYAV